MGNLRIVKITNEDGSFYPLLGRFLSRREIVAELGFPLWDEDGKTWYVAQDRGTEKVLGFAAIRGDKHGSILCSSYVIPQYRKQGVYTALLKARLQDAPAGRVHAVATEASKKALRRAGLKPVREKGKYIVMEMTKK